MNKFITKIVGVALGLTMAIGVGVAVGVNHSEAKEVEAATTEVFSTCDFTTKSYFPTQANYSQTWSYGNFTVFHGNNNGTPNSHGNAWAYVKFGPKPGKSESSPKIDNAYVRSPQLNEAITKVGIQIAASDVNGTVTWGLGVYSDSGYSSSIDTIALTALTHKVADTYYLTPTSGSSWTSGSYYQVNFHCENSTGTNGLVWVEKVIFYYSVNETQTLSATVDEAYVDETITMSTDATGDVTWSIVNDSDTTASGAAITSAGVVSVTGAGDVKVKAHVEGYNDATYILTFNARAAGTYYDVTFNSNGGSESPVKKSILENETFVFPSAGTKTHYSFDGWTSTGSAPYYAVGATSPAVVADITYTAHWTEDAKYNVTYVAGSNGTGGSGPVQEYSGTYTIKSLSDAGIEANSGYRLSHYSVVIGAASAVTKQPGDTITLSANTTITAVFEVVPLALTLEYTGGTTTNMSSTDNNAATLGLDEDDWSVLSDKHDASNEIGLNKANDIRLYANSDGGNGCELIVESTGPMLVLNITLDIKQLATYEVRTIGGTLVASESTTYVINAAGFKIKNTTNGAATQLQLNSISIEYDYVASFKAAQAFETTYIKRNIAYPNSVPTGVSGTDCLSTSKGGLGYYDTAVTEYGKLGSDAKVWFATRSEFANARTRFIAWGTANGASISFDPLTGALSAGHISSITPVGKESSTVLVIILFASISLVAVSSYFVIRRRREN